MKKLLLAMTLVLSIILVMGCASAQKPKEEPVPPPPAPVVVEKPKDVVVDDGNLVLDGAKSYTVARGDMLSTISAAHYNNKYHFPLIMMASGNAIKDPDVISPGMKLTIPDLKKNLDKNGTKKRMKEYYNDVANMYDKRGQKQAANEIRALAASM